MKKHSRYEEGYSDQDRKNSEQDKDKAKVMRTQNLGSIIVRKELEALQLKESGLVQTLKTARACS